MSFFFLFFLFLFSFFLYRIFLSSQLASPPPPPSLHTCIEYLAGAAVNIFMIFNRLHCPWATCGVYHTNTNALCIPGTAAVETMIAP